MWLWRAHITPTRLTASLHPESPRAREPYYSRDLDGINAYALSCLCFILHIRYCWWRRQSVVYLVIDNVVSFEISQSTGYLPIMLDVPGTVSSAVCHGSYDSFMMSAAAICLQSTPVPQRRAPISGRQALATALAGFGYDAIICTTIVYISMWRVICCLTCFSSDTPSTSGEDDSHQTKHGGLNLK